MLVLQSAAMGEEHEVRGCTSCCTDLLRIKGSRRCHTDHLRMLHITLWMLWIMSGGCEACEPCWWKECWRSDRLSARVSKIDHRWLFGRRLGGMEMWKFVVGAKQ